MNDKILKFALTIEADGSIMADLKKLLVGDDAKKPHLEDVLVKLVEDRLAQTQLAGDVDIKFRYKGMIAKQPVLQGGLNPHEWLNNSNLSGLSTSADD